MRPLRLGMSIFFAVLVTMGFLLAPTMLIWGWIRWIRQREKLGRPFFLSLIGFILTTASGVLAVSAVVYVAQFTVLLL